jgi:alanine-synthesizing transaminase
MVNPDLPPPRLVLDRLLESVTKPTNHRYAVSRGVRRLREGFAVKYSETFGVKLDPENQVCVCLGSKDATFHALRALVQPGDAVIVATPWYPAHPSAVALAGAQTVPWRLVEEPEMAAQSLTSVLERSGARIVLLNIPSNPAGMVVSDAWWRAVGAVCARHGATIINDFVYGEMCFSGNPAVSALCAADVGARCVEVYSLSKAYNLPGWRVGALVGDAEIVGSVSRLKSHSDYGLFLPLQYAAAVALTCTEDIVRPTVATYERRLKVLSSGIQRLGWSVVQPKAGACLWAQYPEELGARLEGAGSRSIAVARHLLATTGVVVTPGIVFGEEFDGFIRFAAVTTEERLREVVRMLDQQVQGA